MNMRATGEQLLPAVAYGDAAGLPVETRSAEYIAEKYGVIDHLIDPTESPFYGGAKVGAWSDDTQLSLAISQALIQAEGFDMDAIVQTHIDTYNGTANAVRKGVLVKNGWGKSTEHSVERLIGGTSPMESGEIGGAGNGVLMKMSPLVFWQVAQGVPQSEQYRQYDELTRMTHNSRDAFLATRVHGDMLTYLLKHGYTREGFLDALREAVVLGEIVTDMQGQLGDLLDYLYEPVVDRQAILSHTDKKGFYALQTLAMAYGALIANDGEFEASVYEAVNLGGDTDSTASIIAAMSNFASNDKLILPADYEKLDQLDMVKDVSKELARVALG